MTINAIFRRAKNVSGAWAYADKDESEFVFAAWPEYSIGSVDDFIEGRQGVTLDASIVEALLEKREDAFSAFKSKNFDLMIAKLDALTLACRYAGILPMAMTGDKVKKGASLGHQVVHGTEAEKLERWEKYRHDCLKVASEHPNWKLDAIRQKVAEDNGVSLKTISRRTGDLEDLLKTSK